SSATTATYSLSLHDALPISPINTHTATPVTSSNKNSYPTKSAEPCSTIQGITPQKIKLGRRCARNGASGIIINFFYVLFPREKEPKSSPLKNFEREDHAGIRILHISKFLMWCLKVNRGWRNISVLSVCDTSKEEIKGRDPPPEKRTKTDRRELRDTKK